MATQNIQLVVLDMAGTTILDEHEVEHCFKIAAQKNGLLSSDERILALQGYAKLYVFQTLWAEQLGENDPTIPLRAANSYLDFTHILEDHYKNNEVKPTEGCIELFHYLHNQGIYIALTTGFYRKVANIILEKIGWGKTLNHNYMNIQNKSGIHLSVCPDEVNGIGRPAPNMIELAMSRFGITNKSRVINVGDTPVDLAFGKNAGVRLALGVCNGTHSREQLEAHPHDGLLNNIADLIPFIEKMNHEKI
ncbi:HAD family hydrolase [Aquirufa beregesia]